MLTRTQAQALVESHLSETAFETECDLIVVDDATVEREFGWVFFYQSKQYLETRDHSAQLVGNAPLIVNRFTGDLVPTGTAHPTEYYLERYEASLASGGA